MNSKTIDDNENLTITDKECSLTTEWLSSKKAAEYLDISEGSLRNRVCEGQITPFKFGNLNRFRKGDLDALFVSSKKGKTNGN